MPVTGKIQIIGGDYQNFEGAPLANGYLIVQLSHDEQEVVDPGLLTGMPKIKIALDNTGNIPSSPATMIWPNDQLYPGGSYYTVNGYAADGTYVWGPQFWVLTSAVSPYNVANQVPSNPPGSGLLAVSPAVLLNPSGNQTISAYNLDPAAGNTTQSLGQAGAPWDATLLTVVVDGNITLDSTLTDGLGSVGTSGQVLTSTGTKTEWETPASTLDFANITTGANTTATMTVGAGGTLTYTSTGVVNASEIDGVTVTGTPTAGQVITATSGTAADWQNPPNSPAFNNITSGSNTTATMTVGTGATLEPTGSGVIEANEISGVTVSGTPSTGQVLTATSSSAADWATPLTIAGGGFTKIQAGSANVNNGGTVSFPATFTTLIAVTIGNYSGSANIMSSSTSGFVMATSSSPQRIDWIAVGT